MPEWCCGKRMQLVGLHAVSTLSVPLMPDLLCCLGMLMGLLMLWVSLNLKLRVNP